MLVAKGAPAHKNVVKRPRLQPACGLSRLAAARRRRNPVIFVPSPGQSVGNVCLPYSSRGPGSAEYPPKVTFSHPGSPAVLESCRELHNVIGKIIDEALLPCEIVSAAQ